MRLPVMLSTLAAVSLAVSTAAAEEEDHPVEATAPRVSASDAFRSAGTVVLDDIAGTTLGRLELTAGWLTVRSQTNENDSGHSRSTTLRFAPSADVFVFEGLSVGGLVAVGRGTSSTSFVGLSTVDTTTTTREFAPRIGYAFPVGHRLLVWPRARVSFGSVDTDTSPAPQGRPMVLGGTPTGHGTTFGISGARLPSPRVLTHALCMHLVA